MLLARSRDLNGNIININIINIILKIIMIMKQYDYYFGSAARCVTLLARSQDLNGIIRADP